jgi:16S rRNA (uracil1498-N3)-methyltransferase
VSPPVFLAPHAVLDTADRVTLTEAEARHAVTVMRLRPGERADLTDGAGHRAECVVIATRPGELDLEIVDRHREPRPRPRLAVVQALPKGDRGELAVEMMTEAGVDEILPWAAARCVTRWRADRAEKGLRRWRNAARAAVKQSRGAWLPEVTGPVTTAQVADRVAGAALAVVLHGAAETALSSLEPPVAGAGHDGHPAEIIVVVGPEGGLTDAEVAALAEAGAVPVRLGPTILRTSTAGLAAASIVFSRCGRW